MHRARYMDEEKIIRTKINKRNEKEKLEFKRQNEHDTKEQQNSVLTGILIKLRKF